MGQLCETCVKIGSRCYCAPNSTCEHYEKREPLKLNWNVYYHHFNEGRIETFNIFDHWKFNDDVYSDLLKMSSKAEFAKALRSHLFYYFCSKCEWEVLISPWVGNKNKGEIKVDVYDQVMMNFDIFLEYVWNFKGR